MNEVLVLIGSGVAVLLGVIHIATTKLALKDFPELGPNERGILQSMWYGVGFALFLLGGLPIALVLLNLYVGGTATVVGISCTAFAGIVGISSFISYRKATVAIGRAVPFIYAAIAVLIVLGTFL